MNFSQQNILFNISPTFFLYTYLFAYINSENMASEILLAMFLHEIGHIITIYALGKRLTEIHMSISGIHISIKRNGIEKPMEELLISSAGIVMNVIFLILCFSSNPSISAANSAVAMYNILPAKGLDGGRILENFLFCIFNYDIASILYKFLSISICIAISIFGIIYITFYKFQAGTLLISIYCLYSVVTEIFSKK